TAVSQTTLEAGLVDLRAALLTRGDHPADRQRHLTAYREFRASFEHPASVPDPEAIAALPEEFRRYLLAAAAYHQGDHDRAWAGFEQVLALPAAQRHYRSVWAAYMLARMSLPDDRYDRLAPRFRRVRDLVNDGFVDSAGLAAASYGWEAWVARAAGRDRRAVDLYRTQLSTGDLGAAASLREVADDYLDPDHPERLLAAATDPVLQRLVTRRVASLHRATSDRTRALTQRWLEAVQVGGPQLIDDAAHLAWLAYRTNDMVQAERWLAHARPGLIAQWLQAKLYLRAGKIERGRSILEHLATAMPADVGRFHSGRWGFDTPFTHDTDAARELWAELGVIRLREEQFVEALDAFARGHQWMDAAYVAERVLTIDELDQYLRAPPAPPDVRPVVTDGFWESSSVRERLRSVLARRLARDGRWREAQALMPEEQAGQARALLRLQAMGRDPTASKRVRARALWEAAVLMRTHGLDLVATEMAPDFRVWGGSMSLAGVLAPRMQLRGVLTQPSDEERRRVEAHAPYPQRRFHYRYQAAYLVSEATALLPDGDETKVRLSCMAGNWLKNHDPEAADPFYKAMVNSGHGTELGRRADLNRWFPDKAECALTPAHFDNAPTATAPPPPPAPLRNPLRGLPPMMWLGIAGLGAWGVVIVISAGWRRSADQ
ncbi:MAG: hypothetical protein K0V04_35870, partial [Deltaproteobacteria bacterium]|nr:hypothetical protein [Deltaproteobacteria bacterium]